MRSTIGSGHNPSPPGFFAIPFHLPPSGQSSLIFSDHDRPTTPVERTLWWERLYDLVLLSLSIANSEAAFDETSPDAVDDTGRP